jgi:hypothetical protein
MAAPLGMDRSPDWPSSAAGVSLDWEPSSSQDPRRLFAPGR